ncbi:hypothetical protein [Ferrovibrio sp.]|uniref:hypothetical protein n=1 Tax=Ferrovibrio sp. TaxID=1917215 RepID=UPI0025C37EE6|nr:hypothetical protein [Ferrovibrio sp.]
MKVPQVAIVHMTRQELYELVWASPISKLAEKFGMSDRGIAKICAKAEVPVPERGYWARVQAGQTAAKSPLPAPTAATPERVTIRPPAPRLLNQLLSLTTQVHQTNEKHHVETQLNEPYPLDRMTEEQRTVEIDQKKDAIRVDRLVQQARDHRTACEIRDFVSRVAESDRPKLQPVEFAAWREWALSQANQLDPTRNERLFDLSASNTELWGSFKN